ncbi:hypothetical protein HMPREF0645_1075 [Hallella bergensis DSM 17361]|uniref:Uncharacterized protein n=2 Tax=Hallella bergensis TaxID=242750 RepID=D1PVU0_9BACT|nr:hypothetical protein HMPREF0645_1075 [Hallella bergensis DSM 17361]
MNLNNEIKKKMKTRKLNMKMAAITFGALLAFTGFTSCSNDVDEPTPEVEHKLHEDPAKVELILVDCHLHSKWKSIQDVGGPHQNPDTEAKHIKTVQKIVWQLNPATKKWEFGKDGQEKFYVQKADWYDGEPAPVYMLFIHYYNASGKEITDQFQTEDQRKIHQHFFTAEDVKTMKYGKAEADDNQTEKLFDYLYCDTDPWNKTTKEGGKIIGKEDPVGFKGVLRFLKSRKQFNLRIQLYHGYKSKFFDGGKPRPYYDLSNRLLLNGVTDIDFKIPFVIYMEREDASLFDEDIDNDTDLSTIAEDSLDDDSNRVVHYFMDTFGLSWKDALQEFIDLIYNKKPHSEKGYWL